MWGEDLGWVETALPELGGLGRTRGMGAMFPTLVSSNGICSVDAKRHIVIALGGKRLTKARAGVICNDYVDPFLRFSQTVHMRPEFGSLVSGTELRGYYFGLFATSTIQPIHDFGREARAAAEGLPYCSPIAPITKEERLRLLADAELAEALAVSAELARLQREQMAKVEKAKKKLYQVKAEEGGGPQKKQRLATPHFIEISSDEEEKKDTTNTLPALEPATQRYYDDDDDETHLPDVDIVGGDTDEDEISTQYSSDDEDILVGKKGKAEKAGV